MKIYLQISISLLCTTVYYVSNSPDIDLLTLVVILFLLSVIMGALLCFMSTSIRTDILSMSKLLLLVNKGFFEIYKDRYDEIIDRINQRKKTE